MATIAELEPELGKERRAASREARITRGLPATKPMKLDTAQQKRLLRLYQQGEPVSELQTTLFGVSRSTVFRTLKLLRQQEPVISPTRIAQPKGNGLESKLGLSTRMKNHIIQENP